MNFKEGDVVFISEYNLKKMCIPLSEGSLHTLRIRTNAKSGAYWELENRFAVLEHMLQYPTELLKVLV